MLPFLADLFQLSRIELVDLWVFLFPVKWPHGVDRDSAVGKIATCALSRRQRYQSPHQIRCELSMKQQFYREFAAPMPANIP